MKNFVENIKSIALGAVEASKPTAVLFGTVAETDPIQIQLAVGQTYAKEFFLALDGLEDLKKGDTLVLLRIQGGQQYLILGKKGGL